MTKLFLTGVTGYIGGDALYAIANAHPEYEIVALVRNSDKGAKVAAQYPKIRLVYGDLDSVDLLEKEAKEADIVCHWAHADHEPSIKAIVKGLSAHDPSRPGFLIHTSGTGILLFEDMRAKTYGTAFREKIYDDFENVHEVTSLPDDALHRYVDKIVLEAGTQHADRVKTAIVSPPTIYGLGRGPDNQRSIQLPDLVKACFQVGYAFKVNEGKTYWGNVHVHDLSQLYLKLVEEAAAGGSKAEWPGKKPVWGAEGYYFCENGEHVWGEVSQWVADEGKRQGYFSSNEVKSISPDRADALRVHGSALWSANSRARARRGKELLGWKPTGVALKDSVKSAVEEEAKALGLKPGHAVAAAGEK